MFTIKMSLTLNIVKLSLKAARFCNGKAYMSSEQLIPSYNNLKIRSLDQAKNKIAKCVHTIFNVERGHCIKIWNFEDLYYYIEKCGILGILKIIKIVSTI